MGRPTRMVRVTKPAKPSKGRTGPFRGEVARWERETLGPALRDSPERRKEFVTTSSKPIRRLYTPADLEGWDPEAKLGAPGEYPYARGVYPTMYRGRLWTMRLFAGFGTAEETNARFHYLLKHGQTGLSTAFDLPTLYGYDSDHAMSEGEVGKCGVAVSSLEDMEILFQGIPVGNVSTSMTINAPASAIWAMYLANGMKQGVPLDRLSGTIQNDILKEYQAQKEWIFPPEPHMRLIIDTFEFATEKVPRWHPISISGYHIREAGSTAVQELAFTLSNGMEYVHRGVARGLDPNKFGPRLSFFFNSHNDIFEEIAKFRAARRIWARFMKEEIRVTNERAMLLRFHTQTAGCSCTWQQPEINIVRTAYQGLAAVLGGTQSLHTNSYDEALALPTEKAVRIALRTQQILAYESGVASTIDPLAGSWFIESLTDEMEEEARGYFDRIDALGGAVAALEKGFVQREIADAAYRYQKEIDAKDRIIVGVNDFVTEEPEPELLRIDAAAAARRQGRRLQRLRKRRDRRKVDAALGALQKAAEGDENTMPRFLDAVKAYATLGEMRDALVEVWGEYREPAEF